VHGPGAPRQRRSLIARAGHARPSIAFGPILANADKAAGGRPPPGIANIDYSTVKLVHQSAVALSLTGFFIRGAASLSGAKWTSSRAARTLPHVVDSVLLLSALALVWMLHLSPGSAPWLAAKVVGLVLYVSLGVIALRPGKPTPVRATAWVAALATAAWIVSVAITKSPFGFFSVRV
jgi:uncharacterized membrane protein SirB2